MPVAAPDRITPHICFSKTLTHVTLDGRRSEHRRSDGVKKRARSATRVNHGSALRVATSGLRWCCARASQRLRPAIHYLDGFRAPQRNRGERDRKSTRLNSSHSQISYAVFCLKKKKKKTRRTYKEHMKEKSVREK